MVEMVNCMVAVDFYEAGKLGELEIVVEEVVKLVKW